MQLTKEEGGKSTQSELPWCTKLLKTTKPTEVQYSQVQRLPPSQCYLSSCKSVFYHEARKHGKGPAGLFWCWRVSSLLGQESVSVCFHLLQPLHEMVVGHFHFFDLVQGCTQLRKENRCVRKTLDWLLIWEESDLLYAWIRYYSFKLTDVFFSMTIPGPEIRDLKGQVMIMCEMHVGQYQSCLNGRFPQCWVHTSLWSFLFSAFSSSSIFSELSAEDLYLDTCPSSLFTCKTIISMNYFNYVLALTIIYLK